MSYWRDKPPLDKMRQICGSLIVIMLSLMILPNPMGETGRDGLVWLWITVWVAGVLVVWMGLGGGGGGDGKK